MSLMMDIAARALLPFLLLAALVSCTPSHESSSTPGTTEIAGKNLGDFDQLKNAVLPFAKKMIEEHGEFYPFAASVDLQGKITLVGADTGEGEHPNSVNTANLLYGALKKSVSEGKARSFVVCLNVATSRINGKKTDAIELMLRSPTDNYDLAVPYRKSLSGKFEYDAPVKLATQ